MVVEIIFFIYDCVTNSAILVGRRMGSEWGGHALRQHGIGDIASRSRSALEGT